MLVSIQNLFQRKISQEKNFTSCLSYDKSTSKFFKLLDLTWNLFWVVKLLKVSVQFRFIGSINLSRLISRQQFSWNIVFLLVFIKISGTGISLRRKYNKMIGMMRQDWSPQEERFHCFAILMFFNVYTWYLKIFWMITYQDQENELTIGLKLIQRMKEVFHTLCPKRNSSLIPIITANIFLVIW